jgi:hypothetical protein
MEAKYPEQLPYVEEDRLYVYVGTSERDFLNDPLKHKAWVKGEISNPKIWWSSYIHTGYHPNWSLVQKLCQKEVPDAVEALYHPVWQLRMVLGKPVDDLIQEAKDQWSSYWSILSKDHPQVNYLC